MPHGSFFPRTQQLADDVRGSWKGKVEVNQVYARYQELGIDFHHPDGGQAFYLRDSVYINGKRGMSHVQITEHGIDISEGLAKAMEDVSQGVYDRAPWEFGDLRASGHPTVEHDGETTYDRPPNVHRLSEQELKDKGHLRELMDPNRYAYDRRRA